MKNLNDLTLARVQAIVAKGSYSYEQLMIDTLNTIRQHNPAINAIVALQDEAELISQAREADSTPVNSKLHGIPVALKDLVNVKGVASSTVE